MMETSESLKHKASFLYDPVRKRNVKATPEERVRQGWLKWMIEEGGYPISLLAVEKELASLPHLNTMQESSFPKRRADIIAFANNIKGDTPLFPLLVVECKSVPLTSEVIGQVTAYNSFIGSPFLAIVNDKGALLGRYDEELKTYQFFEGLYSYSKLLSFVSKKSSSGEMDVPSDKTSERSITLASSRTLPGQG